MADALSLLSLTIAAITAYLTLFHRGRLAMVRPSLIAFAHDGGPGGRPKIVIHAMLFSTAYRGNVIESLYAIVHHSGKRLVFANWNYGESGSIVPGSGLFVGKDGVSSYHHFLSLDAERAAFFTVGTYTIEIWAAVAGRRSDERLFAIELMVPEPTGDMESPRFDWNPLLRKYQIEARP